MDEIVRQAMAKWPNVPHCYGWLALDARGDWRMRDEQAQGRDLPGERILNSALVQFINRNYLQDERGCWYFQNGPQRVYVELEATPFIARTDSSHCFTLHTGEKLGLAEAVWMMEEGRLVLQGTGKAALIDDRDLLHCLPLLKLDGKPLTEDSFLTYLHAGEDDGRLTLHLAGRVLPVKRVKEKDLPATFGFVRQPCLLSAR